MLGLSGSAVGMQASDMSSQGLSPLSTLYSDARGPRCSANHLSSWACRQTRGVMSPQAPTGDFDPDGAQNSESKVHPDEDAHPRLSRLLHAVRSVRVQVCVT